MRAPAGIQSTRSYKYFSADGRRNHGKAIPSLTTQRHQSEDRRMPSLLLPSPFRAVVLRTLELPLRLGFLVSRLLQSFQCNVSSWPRQGRPSWLTASLGPNLSYVPSLCASVPFHSLLHPSTPFLTTTTAFKKTQQSIRVRPMLPGWLPASLVTLEWRA